MCLLVRQPEGVVFSEEWLRDFYRKNDDGFGFAYAENNTLYYNRMAGSVDQMLAMYEQVAGKEAILHWRMATAGKVHHDNSHPYAVLTADDGYPLYLAHNGVLACGNSYDDTMSDTYHYIHTFLRPILLDNPELFKNQAFKKMVEGHIGTNNRFAMIDAYGHIEIYNASSGVEWDANEGKPKAWMSNLYAWNSTKAGLQTTCTPRRWFYNSSLFDDDTDSYAWSYPSTGYSRTPKTEERPQWVSDFASDFFKAVSGVHQKAWAKLQYTDAWKLAVIMGEPDCSAFIKGIKDSEYTTEEIIDFFAVMLEDDTIRSAKPGPLVRKASHEVFALLKEQAYNQAWASLRVNDVSEFLQQATDDEYSSLIREVTEGVITDAGIVDAVLAYAKGS